MRAEYVKEWTETYLQVFPEKQNTDSYVESMLKHQPGIGRLECSKEFQDGCECYRYKVSGKKALSAVYAALPMKEAQIRNLLQQLLAALEDARECLLLGEDFLLEPSYMFLSLPQLVLELCYVPGYGKELGKQLEGLFEYLLNRVDYEDRPAVELLYDCHTICMKDREGMEALKKRLEKKENSYLEPMKQPEFVFKEASIPYAGNLAGETVKSEQKSYVSWVKEKISTLRRKKEIVPVQIPEEREKPDKAFFSEQRKKSTAVQFPEQRKKSVVAQFSEQRQGKLEMPDREEEDSRTILLAVRGSKEQPQLIHAQTGEVIVLEQFPFYFGREKEYASYAVEGNGISRLHFCIRKKGMEYYLSDLNSTNGTYVNGAEVLPGMEQKLLSQDTIRVGTEEFVFSLE